MGIHDASTWESTQCMWPSNPPRYGSPLDMRGPPRRLAMDSHADYVAVQQYAVVAQDDAAMGIHPSPQPKRVAFHPCLWAST